MRSARIERGAGDVPEELGDKARWMYPTRRMDVRIVASEKCWSGIEEKMPEISREVI